MTREELIQAITEGKRRRAAAHIFGPGAMTGSIIGGMVGGGVGAAHDADRRTIKGYQHTGGYAGWGVGAGGSKATVGRSLKKMERSGRGKNQQVKADLGQKFAKRHSMTGAFILPRNPTERKKLAKRSTAGHVGHGALRFLAGGPGNLGRYLTKVSYAKSGYHRKNEPMFRREEIEEAIIEATLGKVWRTATGERKKTRERVKQAIEKSKDARYAHRKAMHIKKFMRGASPRNRATGAEVRARIVDFQKFAGARQRAARATGVRLMPDTSKRAKQHWRDIRSFRKALVAQQR